MQIGYNIDNTRKFIDYAKSLNHKYEGEIIVLSLVYRGFQNPRKNKGFTISFGQKDLTEYKRIKTFDDYVIFQIDLDYCFHLISKKDQKLWILNESQTMNDYSKEWIKYLTLPIWCKSTKKYYYEFPPIDKDFFKNEYVYEAFKILSKQDESDYLEYAKYQEIQEKKIKSYLILYKENKEKDEEIEKLKESKNELEKNNKDKEEEIEELKKEIQKLKNNNSNAEQNKVKDKKGKKSGKIRKTRVRNMNSSEDDDK